MEELQHYLKSWFHIPDADMDQIVALFNETEIKKGDFFVKKGHYCRQLSFMKTGLVRVFAEKGDKEVTQWIATKGYFLTDLKSLVFDDVARWNMIALTDCTFYTINKDDYQKIGSIIPNWELLEKRFLAACFITLEDRVFEFLSSSAEERYKRLFNEHPTLFNEVPLQYLASMLGMTPETFSRIRAKK